jgi:hypothetical protein
VNILTAAQPGAVVVACEAVAFVWIAVDGKATHLGRRQIAADLVAGIEVVLAAVGMEAVVFQLIRLQRFQRVLERLLIVGEDCAPKVLRNCSA